MRKGKRNPDVHRDILDSPIKGLFMEKTKHDQFSSKVMLSAVFLLISASSVGGKIRLEVEMPTLVKEALVIRGQSVEVAGNLTAPQTQPAAPRVKAWVHKARVENSRRLAEEEGNLWPIHSYPWGWRCAVRFGLIRHKMQLPFESS